MTLPPHYQDRLRGLRERANIIAGKLRTAEEEMKTLPGRLEAAQGAYLRLKMARDVYKETIPRHRQQLAEVEQALREEEARIRELERKDREEREQKTTPHYYGVPPHFSPPPPGGR